MMVLFKHRWNRIAVHIACISFLLGTILMLTALMANTDLIVTFGIVFLVLYIPVTLILLFILFITTVTNFKDIHEHVMTLIIILMNLPVAFLYFHFLNI